jgi:hypothetical protein
MDNEKELFEELLKSDGIDPMNITEYERTVFGQILEQEHKRLKLLSWLYVGAVWLFAMTMIGLCVSERILNALHIPFVIAVLSLMAAICLVFILWLPRLNRKLKESGKRVSRLHFLVYGKRKGVILIGKKDGKRFIHWRRIIMIGLAFWLIISLAGAGVYYLFCQCWIYSASPIFFILFCTVVSLSFVIGLLLAGLKVPLDELIEVKAKSKPSKAGEGRDSESAGDTCGDSE